MFVYAWRLIVICDYADTSILKISLEFFLSNTKICLLLGTYIHEKSYQLQGALSQDPLGTPL